MKLLWIFFGGLLIVGALWFSIGYVAYHFIIKYW